MSTTKKVLGALTDEFQSIQQIAQATGVSENYVGTILAKAAEECEVDKMVIMDSVREKGHSRSFYKTRLGRILLRKKWNRRMWNATTKSNAEAQTGALEGPATS